MGFKAVDEGNPFCWTLGKHKLRFRGRVTFSPSFSPTRVCKTAAAPACRLVAPESPHLNFSVCTVCTLITPVSPCLRACQHGVRGNGSLKRKIQNVHRKEFRAFEAVTETTSELCLSFIDSHCYGWLLPEQVTTPRHAGLRGLECRAFSLGSQQTRLVVSQSQTSLNY